jgi:uncharacterized protein (UPF0332 family)
MPVSSSQFYDSAKMNLEADDEMGFRNCVSRSYYAMYHEVLSILTESIPNYVGMGSHVCLLTYLQDAHSPEPHDKMQLKRLSFILKMHRDNRNNADYELHIDSIDKSLAEDSLDAYEQIQSICAKLKKAA